MNLSRRKFVKRLAWGSLAVATGSLVYPTLIEPRRVGVTRLRVGIRNLPAAFDGLRVAHLTDFHRSHYVSHEYLTHCVELANDLDADLVLLTGDYLTHGHTDRGRRVYGGDDEAEAHLRDCAGILRAVRARHGVFASLGNHDHWYDGDRVTRQLQTDGIPVLRNTRAEVRIDGQTLPVVGLGDLWTDGVDFKRAFAGVSEQFSLVLMHNPDSFEHWAQPGAHLILSGHTHGGQVNLPLVGPPLVPSRYGAKYAQGLFRRGDAVMYVNRGLGTIFPP
ncbi:MAG: metallophosphoesterase, partial [Lysobacterales bacterium]